MVRHSVSGKEIGELGRIVERFEKLESMFNDDGSVRTVEEYRNYRSPLL